MEPEDPYQVWEYRELTREANREEARSMLERVCKQVQPLMRRRRWRVKRVREFYPRSDVRDQRERRNGEFSASNQINAVRVGRRGFN